MMAPFSWSLSNREIRLHWHSVKNFSVSLGQPYTAIAGNPTHLNANFHTVYYQIFETALAGMAQGLRSILPTI
jgi:hypothetical protein